jgi:hypothetical protein
MTGLDNKSCHIKKNHITTGESVVRAERELEVPTLKPDSDHADVGSITVWIYVSKHAVWFTERRKHPFHNQKRGVL